MFPHEFFFVVVVVAVGEVEGRPVRVDDGKGETLSVSPSGFSPRDVFQLQEPGKVALAHSHLELLFPSVHGLLDRRVRLEKQSLLAKHLSAKSSQDQKRLAHSLSLSLYLSFFETTWAKEL